MDEFTSVSRSLFHRNWNSEPLQSKYPDQPMLHLTKLLLFFSESVVLPLLSPSQDHTISTCWIASNLFHLYLLYLFLSEFFFAFFESCGKKKQKKTSVPYGCMVCQWFLRVCNWVLIKSVSGVCVIVCFQGPPFVSFCVIACYRCLECKSGMKGWLNGLQRDHRLESLNCNLTYASSIPFLLNRFVS